jgi:hypothetical protein
VQIFSPGFADAEDLQITGEPGRPSAKNIRIMGFYADLKKILLFRESGW